MTRIKERKTDKKTLLFIIGTIIIIALVLWMIFLFDVESEKPDKSTDNYINGNKETVLFADI